MRVICWFILAVILAPQALSQPALFQQGFSRRQQQLLQQQQQQQQQQGPQQQQGLQQTGQLTGQQSNYQNPSSQQQQLLLQQQQQQQQYQQLQRQLQQQQQRQRQQQEQQRLQQQLRQQQQQERQRQQQQQQQQQQQPPPANIPDNFGADPGCKDPWTTEWTRDPQDCTMVHFCIQGKQQWTINCNDTRIWSNVGHACVEPMSQWDDCNQEMTTPALNLETDICSVNAEDEDDPRCSNEPSGMNPDPENCAQFVACVNMTVVATMECPTNTLFSTRNNTCELSHVVASECRERSIPEHVVVTTASPIVDKPCEGTSNGDVEDPSHCARFYKCNYGRVVARIRCPSNSAFNEQKRKCDWRANVECGGRPIY